MLELLKAKEPPFVFEGNTSLAVESDLEPGEVIVAITTDASWGPLFLAAGAVVVETGSVISHTAIVSRELGIPAAVSVAGATRRGASGSEAPLPSMAIPAR